MTGYYIKEEIYSSQYETTFTGIYRDNVYTNRDVALETLNESNEHYGIHTLETIDIIGDIECKESEIIGKHKLAMKRYEQAINSHTCQEDMLFELLGIFEYLMDDLD